MPGAGWLAIGAIAAVVGVAPVGLSIVGLAGAGLLGLGIATGRRPLWMAALGVLVMALRIGLGPTATPPAGLPNGDGPWIAVVESVGSVRDGRQVATIRVVEESTPSAVGARLAATLPRYPAIGPGDQIEVAGSVQPPPEGPYGDYLARSGVAGTLRGRSLAWLDADPGPRGRLEAVRGGAGDALTKVLSEPEAGLAAGILIGLRERVDREVAAAFTTAGVSHVVAISGWNIAIVAGVIDALTRRRGARTRILVTGLAIASYTVLAGASASVVRAAVMAGVVLVARAAGRPGRAATALGWAIALLLLVDPGLVGDVGLQLSAAATGGLIAWGQPISTSLARLTRGRLPGWVTEGLGVSLAAQLATLPIIVVAFERLAIVATAVNLVVVPLVPPAMAAGGVALVSGAAVEVGLPTVVGTALAIPAWVLLGAIIGAVRVAAAVPFATVELGAPGSTVVAAMAGLAMLVGTQAGLRRRLVAIVRSGRVTSGRDSGTVSRGRGDRRPARGGQRTAVRAAAALLAVALIVVANAVIHRPDGRLRIVVLDVGQGDAVLLEGPAGGRILVDGGPDPDRLLVALDARVPPWDRRLDLVVLTHPHEDHVAGLALLLDRYGVRHVAEPGMRGAGAGYTAWAERVESGRHDAPFRLAAGDRVTLDGIDLDVRWPLPGRVPAEPSDSGTGINNVSIVFVGRYAGRGFLLAGDIEQAVDPELVAAGLPRVDVLKVAHHGSRTATTSAFLDTVRPAIAVASAGAGNPYGHPARETIERIEATGAALFRTDLDGTVEIAIGADGIRATAGRSRPTTGAPALTASTGSSGLASVASGPTTGGAVASAFACGIPLSATALTPVRPATAVASGRLAETDRPRGWSRPPGGHLDLDAGARVKPAAAADESGRALALLYHRADVGPRPRGRRGALPHDPKARRPRAPHDRLGLAGRRLEARRRASSSRAPPP